MTGRLSLRAGRLGLDLAPAVGGCIARFACDGVELLRPMTAEALAAGRGNEASAYPMVPFAGRLPHGHLAFDGRRIEMAPNWPGLRYPMHGDGWARPWQVERADAQSAALVYVHDGRTGWPLRYCARQSFRLDDRTLEVGMSLENLEPHAAPGGLGLHPFFVRPPGTTLECRVGAAWRTDAEVLPVERIAVPPEWDFTRPRPIDPVALDNGFEAWDGRAVVTWPGRRLALALEAGPPFRSLVIYSPPGRPFFCVEPQSHVPGALAATRLAAGATLGGSIAFHLSNL